MTDYPMRDASDTPPTPAFELEATLPRIPRVVAAAPEEAAHTAPTPSNYHLPWRSIILNALTLWAGTRFIYLIFTYLAAGLAQIQQTKGFGFFGVWQRFDTNWYMGIATQGYVIPQQVAFFPLYPALIRLFSLFTGGDILLSALIVSNLSTLGALIALGVLAAWETRDAENVAPAMLLMLAFPFAFFFTTAYTEGMFVAFAIFCLLFARRGQWGWAALFALLSGATRPTGLVLIPPLAWEWLSQNGLTDLDFWRAQLRQRDTAIGIIVQRVALALRTRWLGLLSIAAVPGFFLGFAAFIGLRFKHPSLILNVRRDYWGLKIAPVWQTAYREISHIFIAPFASPQQVAMILDTLVFLAIAAGVLVFWRAMPGAYNLYMLALLYLSISSPGIAALQILQSTGRYLLPAVPLFIALSPQMRKRPALMGALIAIGFILQGYVALRFLTGVQVE